MDDDEEKRFKIFAYGGRRLIRGEKSSLDGDITHVFVRHTKREEREREGDYP